MEKLFIDTAVPWIKHVEGLDSDHPNDRGGFTRYGMSLRFMKGMPDGDDDGYKDGDINKDGDVNEDDLRLLSVRDVVKIYHDHFWAANQCGRLPDHVALCLFDAVVNHRPKAARMLVQRALGVKADGVIGPVTRFYAFHSKPNIFVPAFASYRNELYHGIVRSNSDQAVFLRGWFRRMALLQQYIQTGELDE